MYEVKTGELEDGTKQQMREGSLVRESQRQYMKLKNDLYSNTIYDVVGEIEVQTNLTRKTIVAILKAIKQEEIRTSQKESRGVYC
ncbi:MAG: hypothetical protein U5L96_11880 [Owenweeksia sp.]|nr:hypothetical protein [Owenweeksia sp.]